MPALHQVARILPWRMQLGETDTVLLSLGQWIELLAVVLALGTLLYSYVTLIFGTPELRVIREEMQRMHGRLGELIEKLG